MLSAACGLIELRRRPWPFRREPLTRACPTQRGRRAAFERIAIENSAFQGCCCTRLSERYFSNGLLSGRSSLMGRPRVLSPAQPLRAEREGRPSPIACKAHRTTDGDAVVNRAKGK